MTRGDGPLREHLRQDQPGTAENPDRTRAGGYSRLPLVGGVPRANPHFTGRENILEQIHSELSSHAGARYLISGGSGVGKSHIAAEYAHRYAAHYDLIWWIPATTDIDAHRSYLRLAEHIGVPVSYEHVPRTVRTVCSELAANTDLGNWLLVFDDAVDVETLAADFFPNGGHGRVLITTQNNHAIPRGKFDGRVVPRLETAESLTLLRRVCPARLEPLRAGERLAEHLEHLPLALAQVGAFLRNSDMGTDEFLELFQERYTDMVTHMGTDDDHTAPLAAAWSIQAQGLRQAATGQSEHDAETRRMVLELVQLSAFFAPRPLSRTMFTRSRGLGTTPDQTRLLGDSIRLGQVLQFMSRHNLAHFNHERNTFQLHELFQVVIRNSLTLRERLHYRELAQRILAQNDPASPEDPGNRADYPLLYAHIKASNAWSSKDPQVRALVLNVIDFLTEMGNYQDAVSLSDQAANAWQGDHPRHIQARLRRNKIRRIHGEYVTALAEAEVIHADHLRREGPDNDETLEAHRSVAIALSGLARFNEAEQIFRQILEHRRAAHTEADPYTLEAAHDYGRVLQEQSRFAESLAVDEHNAEERSFLLGENHVQTLRTGLTIGLNLLFLGRLEEARDRVTECMRRLESVSAADGPHALQGLLALSVIHRRLGEYKTALEYSSRALELYRRKHPPTVRQMLYCRFIHMGTLWYAGHQREALAEAEQLLAPVDERYPAEHPFTAMARIGTATVLRTERRHTSSLELDQEALRRLQSFYGHGTFSTAPAALNLATDLHALGRCEEAAELDAQTEANCALQLSADHPMLLTARRNHLVSRYAMNEDVDQAWAQLRTEYQTRYGTGHHFAQSMSSFTRLDCDVLSVTAL